MTYIRGSEASQKEIEQEGPEAGLLAKKLCSCLRQFPKSYLVKNRLMSSSHSTSSVVAALKCSKHFCPVGMNPQVLLVVSKLAASFNKQCCLAWRQQTGQIREI